MPYVTDLPRALKARGLRVEVVPGWETRGSADFNPYGSVSHWTAGPRNGDRPSLRVCTYGHGSLDGPLCNVFLPRSEVAVVVAAGRANHAGRGGIGGLVGNSSVFGTEAENSGGGEWTDFQRWAYPRINAAYVDLGAKPDHVYGHHEWAPTRKIDIRDYTMDRMRREVAAVLAGDMEDDMPLTDAEKKAIAQEVWDFAAKSYVPGPDGARSPQSALHALFSTHKAAVSAARTGAVDVNALADALAGRLPAGSTFTTDQLEEALRRVLGSVDQEGPR